MNKESKNPQDILRCYMYILPIPWPKREEFRKWVKNLNRFTRDFPASCKGCTFAHVYEPIIGADSGFHIHFEFKTFAQLDELLASRGMQQFHAELKQFLDPCLRGESSVLQRLD